MNNYGNKNVASVKETAAATAFEMLRKNIIDLVGSADAVRGRLQSFNARAIGGEPDAVAENKNAPMPVPNGAIAELEHALANLHRALIGCHSACDRLERIG